MSNVKNIAVLLKFEGSRYHGWQVQKSDSTVAGTLESALTRLCGHTVKVNGCGRTDAGVHAERYCFNFRTSSTVPPERFPFAANALLPADIALQRAMTAPENFDANLSCIKKEYIYRIFNSRIRDPFIVRHACLYHKELRIDLMRRAARHFVGTHDFAAVRSVGTETKTTVRTVHWVDIAKNDQIVEIRICANGFLYNMARAIAGTLVYVSEGKITPDEIGSLLEGRDRRAAGPTMPPGGLTLARLWYDGGIGAMVAGD